MTSPLLANPLLLAQNVQPKAVSPGVEQSSAPAASGPGGTPPSPLASMLPMLLLFAAFIPIFFLSSRRQKKEAAARAALKKGDRVMTNAGIIGELVEIDERLARVKVAPSVHMQFVANTVSPYVEPAPAKEIKDTKPVTEKK
ncbi:MAG: preprotein translocase subunit YajC [Polyangiaceae bacterium]|nr:preprotein translocase subunit YajC [Polyangiaceae bacterium]